MTETPPIIICGMPRSGTRMVATLLLQSPNIAITDEYPLARLRNGNNETAQSLIKNWIAASQLRIQQKAWSAPRIGNKTPLVEMFFEEFEALFAATPPLYVYCLRSPLKVLKSLKNMPWNRYTVEQNWARYKRSIEAFGRMRDAAPDRVMIARVEDISSPDGYVQMGTRLYAFIGEKITAEQERKLSLLQPQQPLSTVLQSKPEQEMTLEETALLHKDPVYKDIEQLLVAGCRCQVCGNPVPAGRHACPGRIERFGDDLAECNCCMDCEQLCELDL